MSVIQWFVRNWFILLQSTGIIGGLLFTAISLRKDAEVRKVQNLISVTHEHRELWTQLYKQPELWRVFDPHADATKNPPTPLETMFVNLVILHLQSVLEAIKQGMFVHVPGIRKDIYHFFSLPIPARIWEEVKALQVPELVSFVERYRKAPGASDGP